MGLFAGYLNTQKLCSIFRLKFDQNTPTVCLAHGIGKGRPQLLHHCTSRRTNPAAPNLRRYIDPYEVGRRIIWSYHLTIRPIN